MPDRNLTCNRARLAKASDLVRIVSGAEWRARAEYAEAEVDRLTLAHADCSNLRDRAERAEAERDALRQTGDVLATAAERVVAGRGTSQQYEYLADAISAWQGAPGAREGAHGQE